MQTEDERRWLLPDGMPDLNTREVSSVDSVEPVFQFYLSTKNGSLRFRHKGPKYYQTIKGKKVGSKAAEWEVEIEEWVFSLMCENSIGFTQKTRTTLRANGSMFELDEFDHPLTGLVIVELEFHGVDDNPELNEFLYQKYQKLSLPEFFGRSIEITGDSRYSNLQLALNGLPEPGHELA